MTKSSKPTNEWRDGPSSDEFVGWLSASGYVEDVPTAASWHVGSWSFEP